MKKGIRKMLFIFINMVLPYLSVAQINRSAGTYLGIDSLDITTFIVTHKDKGKIVSKYFHIEVKNNRNQPIYIPQYLNCWELKGRATSTNTSKAVGQLYVLFDTNKDSIPFLLLQKSEMVTYVFNFKDAQALLPLNADIREYADQYFAEIVYINNLDSNLFKRKTKAYLPKVIMLPQIAVKLEAKLLQVKNHLDEHNYKPNKTRYNNVAIWRSKKEELQYIDTRSIDRY